MEEGSLHGLKTLHGGGSGRIFIFVLCCATVFAVLPCFVFPFGEGFREEVLLRPPIIGFRYI